MATQNTLRPDFETRYENGVKYSTDNRLLNAQIRARMASEAKAAAATKTENDRINDARNEMYGLARADIGRTDPVDAEILAALRGRATGDDVPFNEATTNALFTQQAEMAAQRATNARDRIGGGSITDPAVQAQLRASQAQSDAAMQRARLNIDSQANVANYDARGQALGQASGQNQMMNQNQRDLENRLMNLLMQEQSTTRSDLPQGFTQTRTNPQPQPPPPPRPSWNPAPWQQSPGGLVVAPNQPGRIYNVGTGNMGSTSGSVATNGGQGVPTNGQTWTATGSQGTVTGTNQPRQAQTATPPKWSGTASGPMGTVTNGGKLKPWNAAGRTMLPDYLQNPG